MNTEIFDNATDFLAALKGKKRQHKAGVPFAARSERTGLTTLLLAGWNVSYNAAMQMRLWRNDVTTAWHDDERACCDEAKELT